MRKLSIALSIVAALVMGMLLPLVAAGTIEFGHTWGTSDFERADAIVVDSSGNVYLGGLSYNRFTGVQSLFLLKFDPLGGFLWNRVLGLRANGTVSLAPAPNGDVYLLAQIYGMNWSASVFTARFSAAGDVVWARSIPEIIYPSRIVADPTTGGFLVTSFGGTTGTAVVSAYTPDGTVRWAQGSSGSFIDPAGLAVGSSGGPVLNYYREGGSVGIASFDASGGLAAQRFFNPYPGYATPIDVATGTSGEVFSLTENNNDGSFLLSRFDSALNPAWTEDLRGADYSDYPSRVVTMPDGSLTVLGPSYLRATSGFATNLYHIGANGAVLGGSSFVNTVLSSGQNIGLYALDGVPLAKGGIALAGTTFGTPPMSSQSIVTALTAVNVTWSPDGVTWSAVNLTTSDLSVPVSNPAVPIDDFGLSAGYQAWYGLADVPAGKLTVTVKATVSAQSPMTVTFSTSVTGGRKPYTYTWSFGDGTTGTGSSPTHTYAAAGRFLAQVVVTDSAGVVGYGNTVVVLMGPPTIVDISMYPSPVGYAGDWVSFYADVFDGDGGTVVQYQWSYGDGYVDVTSYPSASHIYWSPGNYTLTLTATDSDQGLSSSLSIPVGIVPRPDSPPYASFYWYPYNPTANSTVYFSASPSYDSDGYIVQYTWNFGDGSGYNSSYPDAWHSYPGTGFYPVTLLVVDNAGLSAMANQTVVVAPDRPPVALFRYSPYVPFVNQSVFFYGGDSYDPDGYIVAWHWDFGDGSSEGGGGNLTNGSAYAYHVYSQAGPFTVTLTVTDNAGLTGTANQSLFVDAPPVAILTPARAVGKTGVLLQFTANASYDPDGGALNFTWTFGDGTGASGPWVTHVYANPGQYTVTLLAVDAYGARSYAALSYPVTIPKAPVSVMAWSPVRAIAAQTLMTFDGSNSLDPDGAITTYIWEFGDGTVGRGKTATHTFAYAGTYTVELVVIDEDGLSDRDVQTLTVVATSKGTVTASGLSMPIGGALVTVSQEGRAVLTLMTSAEGTFSLGDLAPGVYAITIAKMGFQTYRGPLLWDGINGDLGTFRLEPAVVEPSVLVPAEIGAAGVLVAAAVGAAVLAFRIRRIRRRRSSFEDRR